jgi:hypothetical protein
LIHGVEVTVRQGVFGSHAAIPALLLALLQVFELAPLNVKELIAELWPK